MGLCDKVKDIENNCDSASLNLASGVLAVRLEALSFTQNAVNGFLLDTVTVIDPDTGAYPLPASAYYPVKAEWYLNTVKANYEVVEGTATADKYAQTIGNVVITDSESAEGKLNIKGLNSNLWAIVAKLKGVNNQEDTFHVYGVKNGLKFLVAPTADEFGGRVVGMFRSVAGAEESTPNGVNWLDTDFANTNALYNQRLDPVIIP
jgi:hypothetical protein